MADWADLQRTENYLTLLETRINDRDLDAIKMLDGVTPTNLPLLAKRWNATNKRWEKWDGAGWVVLADKYLIDVDTVDGYHAGNAANQLLVLDGSGLVPLAQIPADLTGKNASAVGGYAPGPSANQIPVFGTSGDLVINNVRVGIGGGGAYYNGNSIFGAVYNGADVVGGVSSTGQYNSAFGYDALIHNTSGYWNSAFGAIALNNVTTGYGNSAFGFDALGVVTTGIFNTGIGEGAGDFISTGDRNTVVGAGAGKALTTSSNSTAIGYLSLYTNNYTNATGLGSLSTVSGNNQVQLGDSATTTYAYGAVQNRSDKRDKTDITDTVLGLEFVNRLRPVDFRWNYREDYRVVQEAEGGGFDIKKVPNDGSKARTRKHHGLIAQQVKSVMDELGVDFGGYQDHKIAGGEDVLSIGYQELIAPMIRSIQELNQRLIEIEASR